MNKLFLSLVLMISSVLYAPQFDVQLLAYARENKAGLSGGTHLQKLIVLKGKGSGETFSHDHLIVSFAQTESNLVIAEVSPRNSFPGIKPANLTFHIFLDADDEPQTSEILDGGGYSRLVVTGIRR